MFQKGANAPFFYLKIKDIENYLAHSCKLVTLK